MTGMIETSAVPRTKAARSARRFSAADPKQLKANRYAAAAFPPAWTGAVGCSAASVLQIVVRAVTRGACCQYSGFALANYQTNCGFVAKPGCSPIARRDIAPGVRPGFVARVASCDSAVDFDYSPAVVIPGSVSAPRHVAWNCFGCHRRSPAAADFPSLRPARDFAGRPARRATAARPKLSTRAPEPGESASGWRR